MKFIPTNPYEAARASFFGFQPNALDADWKEYCGQKKPEEMTDIDGLISLAGICNAGAADKPGLFTEEERRYFSYSAGFFEALLSIRYRELKLAA